MPDRRMEEVGTQLGDLLARYVVDAGCAAGGERPCFTLRHPACGEYITMVTEGGRVTDALSAPLVELVAAAFDHEEACPHGCL